MTSESHTVTCECGFESSYESETSAQAARAGHTTHCSEETVLDSDEDETVYFAFGDDTYEHAGLVCKCPSVEAGYSTKRPGMSKVAGKFDELVFEIDSDGDEKFYHGVDVGVVPEDTAKEAWLKVIEFFESQGRENHLSLAEDVAEDLGWL